MEDLRRRERKTNKTGRSGNNRGERGTGLAYKDSAEEHAGLPCMEPAKGKHSINLGTFSIYPCHCATTTTTAVTNCMYLTGTYRT